MTQEELDPQDTGPNTFVPARIRDRGLDTMTGLIHLTEEITKAAYALTRPHDWTFFGDRPWLCRNGAEGIRRRMGLTIKINQPANSMSQYVMYKEADDDGEYMVCELSGVISHPELGSLDVFGFASTRDKFFGKAGDTPDGKILWKPLSEVNLQHVKMKAYTNLIVNAVTRFVGLTPSKEDLETMFGAGKVGNVKFREREDKRTPEAVEDETKKAKALWAILVTMNEGNENGARVGLEALSAFKVNDNGVEKTIQGVTDVNKLKGRRLEIACKKGKEIWEQHLKANPSEAEFLKGMLANRLKGEGAPA